MFNFDSKTEITDSQIAKTLRTEAKQAAVMAAIDHIVKVDGVVINGEHIPATLDRKIRAKDMIRSMFCPNADDPNRDAVDEYFSTRMAEQAESESSTKPKGVDLTKYPSEGVSLAKE